MDRFDLYILQEEEFASYIKERTASYDQLRKHIIKSIWKLRAITDGDFIESVSLIMSEVQQWEDEWGYTGRRKNNLSNKHAKEWYELGEYHKLINEFKAMLTTMQN